jgi:hypothetical protein
MIYLPFIQKTVVEQLLQEENYQDAILLLEGLLKAKGYFPDP